MAAGKLVIAGGSGFLGRLAAQWFARRDWDVVVLSRRPSTAELPARIVCWNGKTMGDWAEELEGAAAILNLAGRSVNCRYHAANRREMLASRIDSTRLLGFALARCACPPPVWLNSSTATIYKHIFDRAMDERTGAIEGTREAKDLFSVEIAQAWEAACQQADTPRTRKVLLRTAMVLGTEPGTVYRILRRLARRGLGGSIAGGRQYVSWIHAADFCRALEWLIAREDLSGPVNLAAPQPLTNRELMATLRRACGVPFGLPTPRMLLEIGAFFLRTESELVIKSRRVVPTLLTEGGFTFRFPDFASAVRDLERQLAESPRMRAGRLLAAAAAD